MHPNRDRKFLNKTFIFSICIFIFSILAILVIQMRKLPVIIETNLEKIPYKIGEFSGTDDRFPQSVYDELNADQNIYRHYIDPDMKTVDLYIGYYGTAKRGRTPHNPFACLPGSGWGIKENGKIDLRVEGYSNTLKLNYIVSQKGLDNFNVMIFWQHSDKTKVLSDGFKKNINRFINKLLYNRNDGAFVRIDVNTNEAGIDASKEICKDFSIMILKMLPHYWPLEK